MPVTRRTLRPTAGLLAAGTLLIGGCSTTSAPADDGVTVVATTTQLGSIVGDITACAGGTSTTLMGPGDDPHEFAVSSAQVASLVRADLVVANGLGLEQSLEPALENAVSDGATLYEVAPNLNPLSYADLNEAVDADHGAEESGTGADHDHGTEDPHVFLDAGRMAEAAALIGARIADVTGDDSYSTCGSQVSEKLQATDAEVTEILSTIPEDRRVLLTDHEAYNYFADAYGFRIVGVVIPGGGTDAEPSSAELADLVTVIRDEGVHVLFSNNSLSPVLLESLAAEAGGDVTVVQLYTGSLGEPGSGADTYAGMMLTNAHRIADALA